VAICETPDFMFPMLADVYYPIVEQGAYGDVKKNWVLDKTVACQFNTAGTANKEELRPEVKLLQDSALVGRVKSDIRFSSEEGRNGLTNILITNITDKNGNQKWLTIPVASSNRALIKDSIINGHEWKTEHLNKVKNYYENSNMEYFYLKYLSKMDTNSYSECLVNGLYYLKDLFWIKTKFVLASDLSSVTNGGINELVNLVNKVKCDVYLSGPTCLEYGFTHEFAKENGVDFINKTGEGY